MFLLTAFETFVYQPFFNVLVFFYWGLDVITGGNPDMGIAVILLTVLIRFLLLPLSLAGDRSEKDRRKIASQVKELEVEHRHDPVKFRSAKKILFRRSRAVVAGEVIGLSVQVTIALMLWRVFGSGLQGQDLDLIYPFMPAVDLPFNLLFLDRFDLGHTNLTLNLVQSLLIFVAETLSLLISPYPVTRGEVVRLQLTLPVVSFLIFMGLPAGKKLFIITTLIFSIVLMSIKAVRRHYLQYKQRKLAEQAALSDPAAAEQVVVATK
ncbi:MAG: hypothetical protein COU69_03515 [Candidatus Pacebacteria bacterium CG10_big_fil_rev_8_21_14_0_10_56_10]|nr:MAG: hypothetical protein COU69_03515 [Candidatus Pacebacteria bacterium CG10_big_fil_rev_8_21_14_0_10_56_10]